MELLELAKGNATLLLNLRDPPREHPYRGSFLNVTLEALLRSGFPQHQVRPCSPVPPSSVPKALSSAQPCPTHRETRPAWSPAQAVNSLCPLSRPQGSTFVK